jgi:hypothetical protein
MGSNLVLTLIDDVGYFFYFSFKFFVFCHPVFHSSNNTADRAVFIHTKIIANVSQAVMPQLAA